jgi:hypothetical protein
MNTLVYSKTIVKNVDLIFLHFSNHQTLKNIDVSKYINYIEANEETKKDDCVKMSWVTNSSLTYDLQLLLSTTIQLLFLGLEESVDHLRLKISMNL